MQNFSSWYKQLQTLPRWAQSLIGLGMLVLFVIIALVGTFINQTPEAGAPGSALSTFWTMLGIFWRLGLVLLIAYFSLYFLRRWQGNGLSRARKQLTVLESHHLSPRQAVYLIQVGEQTFFIGATDQSISLLSEVSLTADETAASTAGLPDPSQATFAETLSSARQGKEQLP